MRLINPAPKISIVLLLLVVCAFLIVTAKPAQACCYPCPAVLDDTYIQQALEWYNQYARPYVEKLYSNYQKEERQRLQPGVFSNIASGYLNMARSMDSSKHSSSDAAVRNALGYFKSVVPSDASSSDLRDENSRKVTAQIGGRGYGIGDAGYRRAVRADEQLSVFSPNSFDFAPSSGVRKDVVKLAIVQGDILAATLEVLAAKGANHAIK